MSFTFFLLHSKTFIQASILSKRLLVRVSFKVSQKDTYNPILFIGLVNLKNCKS